MHKDWRTSSTPFPKQNTLRTPPGVETTQVGSTPGFFVVKHPFTQRCDTDEPHGGLTNELG